jgi:rhamnosyltransferase
MLRAGYAKAFVPQAAVIHSHAYTPAQQLRRCFDEWRGLREIYGWREPSSPRHLLSRLRGALGNARAELAVERAPPARRARTLANVGAHELVCLSGALLGSRADRLPARVRRLISLEGQASFAALQSADAAAAIEGPRR